MKIYTKQLYNKIFKKDIKMAMVQILVNLESIIYKIHLMLKKRIEHLCKL